MMQPDIGMENYLANPKRGKHLTDLFNARGIDPSELANAVFRVYRDKKFDQQDIKLLGLAASLACEVKLEHRDFIDLYGTQKSAAQTEFLAGRLVEGMAFSR